MLGWDGGPSLQLLWPEITQGQVHRDKHTIGARTKVIQVHKEKDTQRSAERGGGGNITGGVNGGGAGVAL